MFTEAIPLTSHGRWEQNFPSFAAYNAPFFPPAVKSNASPSEDGCCLPAALCQEEPCLPTGRETGRAGQIEPNWGCSDEHTARSWEDKDTAGIPGRSARPLVGQAEEVRLLAVRDVIHVLWKTNALSVFPRLYCLPDGSLLNKETLSMETWAGRIL